MVKKWKFLLLISALLRTQTVDAGYGVSDPQYNSSFAEQAADQLAQIGEATQNALSSVVSSASSGIKSVGQSISAGARQVQLWIQEKLGLLTIADKIELELKGAQTPDDVQKVRDAIAEAKSISAGDNTYGTEDSYQINNKLNALEQQAVTKQRQVAASSTTSEKGGGQSSDPARRQSGNGSGKEASKPKNPWGDDAEESKAYLK